MDEEPDEVDAAWAEFVDSWKRALAPHTGPRWAWLWALAGLLVLAGGWLFLRAFVP